MKTLALAGMVAGLTVTTTANAQNTFYWPAPVSAAQASTMSYFPLGTPIMLRTRTEVSTKDNKPGDRFYLEVAEPVSYRGQTVIPAGSVAVGEVARSQRNGYFGVKGKLEVHLLYVQTPSGPVRLSGRAAHDGTSGTITSIATIALVSPLGFLVHGTSSRMPAGTVIGGYLAEDMRFAVQPQQPQVAMNQAVPDGAMSGTRPDPDRRLPASFTPGMFGGSVPQTASR